MSKATFVQGYKDLIDQVESTGKSDPDAARDQYASGLADLIKALVEASTITVAAGIPVTTATPSGPGTGATTAPGTASLAIAP